MRIVAYHPALRTPGGAEVLMVDQMRHLADRGHDVRLVLLDYDPEPWRDAVGDFDVREVSSDWRERLLRRRPWTRIRARSRRVVPHLDGADIVIGYNYPCSALASYTDVSNAVWHCCEPSRTVHLERANPELMARAGRDAPEDARCVGWIRHEHAYHLARGTFRDERIRDRESVTRMGGVIAISEYSDALIRNTFDRKADAIVRPIVRFPEPTSRSGGLLGDGLHVLLHTRLHAHKNPDTVLRGFALHHARDPRSSLDVVGEGPEIDVLAPLARELGIGEAVTFHGYLPQLELERVYRRCDVLACLPMDEPFGLVFPEAAARGLLLVGPNHGGPVEILDGGALGTLVDALSPEALAEALARIAGLAAGEVDRLREEADRACRSRYARGVVGPELEAVLARFARDLTPASRHPASPSMAWA